MSAASKGHIEVVKTLLDRNANIEALDTVRRKVSVACAAVRIVLITILIIILLLTIFNILLNYIFICAIVIVHNA